MKITHHPFTNDEIEYKRIKQLLAAVENAPDLDNNWEPGRMDWWRYNYHVEKGIDFFETNAHYWMTEADQVVGLFISEYARNDFFAVVHPEFRELLPEILNWGLEVWAKGKSAISTDVYTFGQEKIAQLLAAGFYEDSHIENIRIYRLPGYDFNYSLKSGFQMMTFADFGDYGDRVKLVQNSFDNPNFNEARLRSMQESPNYRPNLDLIIVNQTSVAVGYCMGWVEENNPKVGFIEPMGVHSEYRKNGFGKSLAIECFKRLADLGVETAWIASNAEPDISNFLYDSLNPTTSKRSYRYTRDLEGHIQT